MQGSAHIKEAIEKVKFEMEEATRKGEWQKVSELQYGKLPELEKLLSETQAKELNPEAGSAPRLLRTQVGAEEIAEVVARSTGIPVARMLEGERDKLLRMESVLSARVVGQDEAVRVVEQLRAQGRVSRGRIGVGIGQVSKEVAESLGLAKAQGALVTTVEAGSPADKAGVEAGDIILRFNGKAIEKAVDLPRIVGEIKPGSKATLSVWRKTPRRSISPSPARANSRPQAARPSTCCAARR